MFAVVPILAQSMIERTFQIAGNTIYACLGLLAIVGMAQIIVLLRQISQKRFGSKQKALEFQDEIRELLLKQDLQSALEICDSSQNRNKATAQIVLIGLANHQRPMPKLRRLLGDRFEREVLAGLEYGMSWISTYGKSAPMLGLLGTVCGMIAAFDKIASAEGGIEPQALASDISLALFTTGIGLAIAIPLVLAGALLNVRLGKMQDEVQDQLNDFLEDLDYAMQGGGAAEGVAE